jgi:hypothetical protein
MGILSDAVDVLSGVPSAAVDQLTGGGSSKK